MSMLVKNARILDPAQKLDGLGSLLVVEGVVTAIGPDAERDPMCAGADVMDAGGKLLECRRKFRARPHGCRIGREGETRRGRSFSKHP